MADNFPAALRTVIESNDQYFKNAEFLKGLNFNDPADADEIWKRIKEKPKTIEYWGFWAAAFGSIALDAIEKGNASLAAWAMAIAERFRALAIFKSSFEEAVLIGNSARRLVNLLRTWDSNKENSDEGFWQITLKENAFAISQIFSVPVMIIQDKAYVGGMTLEGTDARYLRLHMLRRKR